MVHKELARHYKRYLQGRALAMLEDKVALDIKIISARFVTHSCIEDINTVYEAVVCSIRDRLMRPWKL